MEILKGIEEFFGFVDKLYKLDKTPINIKNQARKRAKKVSAGLILELNKLNKNDPILAIWLKNLSNAKPETPPYFLSEHLHKLMCSMFFENLEEKNLPELAKTYLQHNEKLLVDLILKLFEKKDFQRISTLEETIISNQFLINECGFLIFSLLANSHIRNIIDPEPIRYAKAKKLYQFAFTYKPNFSKVEKSVYERSCCHYGVILLNGTEDDYPDFKLAAHYLKKSQSKNANISLSYLYARGLGVEQDIEKSIQLLTAPDMIEEFFSYMKLCANLSFYENHTEAILNHFLKFLTTTSAEKLKAFPYINYIYSAVIVLYYDLYKKESDSLKKESYRINALDYLEKISDEKQRSFIFLAKNDPMFFDRSAKNFIGNFFNSSCNSDAINSYYSVLEKLFPEQEIISNYFSNKYNFFVNGYEGFLALISNPLFFKGISIVISKIIINYQGLLDALFFIKEMQLTPNARSLSAQIIHSIKHFKKELHGKISLKKFGMIIHYLACIGVINEEAYLRNIIYLCDHFYGKTKQEKTTNIPFALSLFFYDLALLHHQYVQLNKEFSTSLPVAIAKEIERNIVGINKIDYEQIKTACFYFLQSPNFPEKNKSIFSTLLSGLGLKLNFELDDYEVDISISFFQQKIHAELRRYLPEVTQEYKVQLTKMKKSLIKSVDTFQPKTENSRPFLLESDGWKHLQFMFPEEAKEPQQLIFPNPKTAFRNTLLSWCVGHARIVQIFSVDKDLPDIKQGDNIDNRIAWFRFFQIKLKDYYKLASLTFFLKLNVDLQAQEKWRQTNDHAILGCFTYKEMFGLFHHQDTHLTTKEQIKTTVNELTEQYQIAPCRL